MKAFVTGTAGFIGYHLARRLLEDGASVHGFDAMTDYYDVALKRRRHEILLEHQGFSATEARLEDDGRLDEAAAGFRPDVIVHLAAQAGVRYSIDNPRAYVDSNLVGTFSVMEAARELGVRHLVMASTSSVYGANEDMPYRETHRTDAPLTFYAATKKACEAMAHSYAHLWNLPTTMVRFFTVYGPWGRPDMAPHKFTRAILAGEPIELYNRGEMDRDFTFVDDVAQALRLLADTPPPPPGERGEPVDGDTLSPVAPYRIVNIGASERVKLLDFVAAIEEAAGRPAIRKFVGMQKGDVPATWADSGLLERLTGFRPRTGIREGIRRTVAWHREHYHT